MPITPDEKDWTWVIGQRCPECGFLGDEVDHDRLGDLIRALAPPWRTLLVVDLPVVWKPLLAAAGFAFAVSLGEFGATSFLARPESPTLPVVIVSLLGRPGDLNYGMALAASVVLAASVAAVVLVVERLRVRSVGAF